MRGPAAVINAMFGLMGIDSAEEMDEIFGKPMPREKDMRSEQEVAELKERAEQKRKRKAAKRRGGY